MGAFILDQFPGHNWQIDIKRRHHVLKSLVCHFLILSKHWHFKRPGGKKIQLAVKMKNIAKGTTDSEYLELLLQIDQTVAKLAIRLGH